MKAGAGKAKGGEFERKVCKELSRWLSQGRAEDWFWRSAMSGGRATVAKKAGKKNYTAVGDLSAVGEEGQPFLDHFVIECKFVADLQYPGAITRGVGSLATFWTKHMQIAGQHRKPLLIAKQNQFPTMLFTTRPGIELLTGNAYDFFYYGTLVIAGAPVAFMPYDELLKLAPPSFKRQRL